MDTQKEITLKLAAVHVRQLLQGLELATKNPALDQRGTFALSALYLNVEHQLGEQEKATNVSDTTDSNPPAAGGGDHREVQRGPNGGNPGSRGGGKERRNAD